MAARLQGKTRHLKNKYHLEQFKESSKQKKNLSHSFEMTVSISSAATAVAAQKSTACHPIAPY